MRKLLILGSLVVSLSAARLLPAQQPTRRVNAVQLRFEKVDQVALDFGVDTAEMRGEVIRRLNDAGIAVATDVRVPELRIAVLVPKSLAPVDVGILSVELALLAPDKANTHRMIWHNSEPTVRFTTYGSLRQLAPERLARGLDELTAAHRGT
jgi:hypothetical protein